MSIKLRRLDALPTKPGKYSVVLKAHVNAEFLDYQKLYQETYQDAAAKPEELLAAIVDQFLAGDQAFQAWKRRHRPETTRKRRAKRSTPPSASHAPPT